MKLSFAKDTCRRPGLHQSNLRWSTLPECTTRPRTMMLAPQRILLPLSRTIWNGRICVILIFMVRFSAQNCPEVACNAFVHPGNFNGTGEVSGARQQPHERGGTLFSGCCYMALSSVGLAGIVHDVCHRASWTCNSNDGLLVWYGQNVLAPRLMQQHDIFLGHETYNMDKPIHFD